MMVTLFILAVYFYLISRKVDVSKYGWVPLVNFILYVLGFSVGIGPISWLMMGEILPTRIRSVGASLVVCFNWACVFVVTKTFQDLIGEYKGKPNGAGFNPCANCRFTWYIQGVRTVLFHVLLVPHLHNLHGARD